MAKREAIDFYRTRAGDMYVLEQDARGVFVIYLNNRTSSIHSDLELAKARMKKYREEDAN